MSAVTMVLTEHGWLPSEVWCEVCDASLVGKRPHTRTCSPKCRVALHRRTMKEALDGLTGEVTA